jgi:hypothetical protein
MTQSKIKLAIEIIQEILDDTNIDYDIHLYKYKQPKGKILLGITFPNLLSKRSAGMLARHLARQIEGYATHILRTSWNTYYICFDIGTKN